MLTNEQLLVAYEQLLTDFELLRDTLRHAIDLNDELLPMSRRYATPRELGELAGRGLQVDEHRAVLTRFIA